MKYHFRAELHGNEILDFHIYASEDLHVARKVAEGYLIQTLDLLPETEFDWRGQVVFVAPEKECR